MHASGEKKWSVKYLRNTWNICFLCFIYSLEKKKKKKKVTLIWEAAACWQIKELGQSKGGFLQEHFLISFTAFNRRESEKCAETLLEGSLTN